MLAQVLRCQIIPGIAFEAFRKLRIARGTILNQADCLLLAEHAPLGRIGVGQIPCLALLAAGSINVASVAVQNLARLRADALIVDHLGSIDALLALLVIFAQLAVLYSAQALYVVAAVVRIQLVP